MSVTMVEKPSMYLQVGSFEPTALNDGASNPLSVEYVVVGGGGGGSGARAGGGGGAGAIS